MPLAECLSISSSIVADSVLKFGSIDQAIPCLAMSTILSSCISLLIYKLNLGKSISSIPAIVTDALLISTALFNFKLASDIVYIKDNNVKTAVLLLSSILFLAIGLTIMKIAKDAKFIVVLLILLILSFNIFAFFFPSYRSGANSLFLDDKKSPLSIRKIYGLSTSMKFDYGFTLSKFFSIFNLAIFPLISFATTLPHFSRIFSIPCNFNSELKSLGFVNLLCTTSFFPVTMNCTGSIFFRLMGATDSYSAFIGGVFLIILYFVFHYIVPFIPIVAVSFIAMFIGSSILLSYINQVFESTLLDTLFLISMSIVCIFTTNNILLAIPLCIFISFVKLYIFTGQILPNNDDPTVTAKDDKITFTSSKSLDFTNTRSIFNHKTDIFRTVVFDLTNCKYIDYTANLLLLNLAKSLTSDKKFVKVLGEPKNMCKGLRSYIE